MRSYPRDDTSLSDKAYLEELISDTPEVIGLQTYEYFRHDTLATPLRSAHPASYNLTYPELDRQTILSSLRSSEQVIGTLGGRAKDRNRRTMVLLRSIQHRSQELSLLAMSAEMNDCNLAPAQRAMAREHFRRLNAAIYGLPEPDIFITLAKKHIVELIDSHDADPILAQELRSLLGTFRPSNYVPTTPPKALLERIGRLVRQRYGYLLEDIQPCRFHTPEDIAQVFEGVMQKIGADQLGWKVERTTDSATLAVAAHSLTLEVGMHRAPLKGAHLRCKVLHEIVHVIRSINAQHAGWPSAAYGQEGYLDFEEALCVALEGAYQGTFVSSGELYYVIAGLALGQDDHPPRTLAEVYEIAWRMQALAATVRGSRPLGAKNLAMARRQAWQTSLRIFRGTSGQEPGIIYTKDLAYYRGQGKVWTTLEQVHSQGDMDMLLAGKLDLTNPSHCAVAEQIVRTVKCM